jgi:hypothetical protein
LQVQKLVACAIVCWWVARSSIEERHITYAIAASFPVVAGLVVTDTYYGSFGNENFVTEWVILCLPWLGWAALSNRHSGDDGIAVRSLGRSGWRVLVARCWGMAIGSGGIFYLIAFNNSRIEFFVAFVGCLTLLWLCKQRAWAVTLFCVGLGGALYGDIALDSLKSRVEFSVNTLAMFLDAPLLGHGFGAFNFNYPAYQIHRLFVPWESMGATNFAGAAHNEYLQILAELGAVGLLLALWVIWRPWKLGPATICLTLGMIQALINFPFQNPASAFLLSVSFGLVLRSQSAGAVSVSGEAKRLLRSLSLTPKPKTR